MVASMNDNTTSTSTGTPEPPAPPREPGLVRRRVAGAAAVGGLAIGGLLGGYVISHAATAVASPSASPSPSGSGSGSGTHDGTCPGGPHGLQAEDLTLVAGVIGISGSDLQTALGNGQTIAAVAKAHNVDVNKVISTWVASENKEIDDRVSSGQITKAQGDQMKAMTQQRVTDQVNGTFHGRPGGPAGFAGPPPGA